METKLPTNELATSINAMLRREKESYITHDYLKHLPPSVYGDFPVDGKARDAIVNWFFKVVGICDYSLETAAVATSLLDRFACSDAGKDIIKFREKFQLASLTAIYTAVKVHEREAVSPSFVAKLSGGLNTKEDIEKMEMQMLKALKWNVNPPTALWFAQQFLDVLEEQSFDKSTKRILMNKISSQITYSLLNYRLCTIPASEVALAALLNAVETIYDDRFLALQLEAQLCTATNIKATPSIDDLRIRLCGSTLQETLAERVGVQPVKKAYGENRNETSSQQGYSPKSITARS